MASQTHQRHVVYNNTGVAEKKATGLTRGCHGGQARAQGGPGKMGIPWKIIFPRWVWGIWAHPKGLPRPWNPFPLVGAPGTLVGGPFFHKTTSPMWALAPFWPMWAQAILAHLGPGHLGPSGAGPFWPIWAWAILAHLGPGHLGPSGPGPFGSHFGPDHLGPGPFGPHLGPDHLGPIWAPGHLGPLGPMGSSVFFF